MPFTISLRRTSRASRFCTVSDLPYGPLADDVQTSAPDYSSLPTKPRRQCPTCNHPAIPIKGLEGALCGKPASTSRTHLHGEWYRPVVLVEEPTDPGDWWRDFGGEG